MVYIYEDDRHVLHGLDHKLKHSVKSYIGSAETRSEAKQLLEEYYGENRGNKRETIMWFLNSAFSEKGIFKIEAKYRHVEILHDDKEYLVRTVRKSPFSACQCFNNVNDAMDYAWDIENAVEETADKMADLCSESLKKFQKKYGEAATKALLPEIDNMCFGRLADDLNIHYHI